MSMSIFQLTERFGQVSLRKTCGYRMKEEYFVFVECKHGGIGEVFKEDCEICFIMEH